MNQMKTIDTTTQRRWHPTDGFVLIEDQARQLIADVGTEREWTSVVIDDDDGEAAVMALCHPMNAPLVSAAPELLAALIGLVECPDYRGIETHEMGAARAAIAKAKGTK